MHLDESVEGALDQGGGGGALGAAGVLDPLVGGGLRPRGLLGRGRAHAVGHRRGRLAHDLGHRLAHAGDGVGLGGRLAVGGRFALGARPAGGLLGRGVQGQQQPQLVAQRGALHDAVHKAMLQLELGALKADGQLAVDGLLDDARAREGHQGLGLGQDHVALHGEGGRDTARGGVGEDRHIEAAAVAEAPHGRRGLGHLHERGGALLHAGAAAHGEAYHGQPLFGGVLKATGDLLAHHGSHGAHHEVAVHHKEGAGHPLDGRAAAHHGVDLAALGAGSFELLDVVGEAQKVAGRQVGVPLDEAALVCGELDAPARAQAHVVPAVGAYVEVRGDLLDVDHAVAAGALGVEAALGHLHGHLGDRALKGVAAFLSEFRHECHRGVPSGPCGRCRPGTRGGSGCRAAARSCCRRPRWRARPGPSASCAPPPRGWARAR